MTPTDFIIRYGRSGFVGCFQDAMGREFRRGDTVAIRTPRGIEQGEVLCPAKVGQHAEAIGPIVNLTQPPTATVTEDVLMTALEFALDNQPLQVLDVELLLDGSALVHAVVWEHCNIDPILAELSDRFVVDLRLHDVSAEPLGPSDPKTDCGKPGCGTKEGGCDSCSSGGCSTGSCSKGVVKNKEELTNYFAGLRKQMEQTQRLPLH